MRTTRIAVAGVLAVALSSACSDDAGPTAEEQVCDAASEVRTSLRTVVDDVREADFGAAKDALPAVGSALDDLGAAAQDLGEERRSDVEPDLQAAQDALGSLTSANSLADISAALTSARTSIESAIDTAGRSADCSDS